MINRLLHIHEHHDHDHHDEEEDEVAEDVEYPFTSSKIYDLQSDSDIIPEGFDAVRIVFDGKMTADLSWKEARNKALEYVKRGYRIFWDIDLGLFHQLTRPLTDQSQFLSLALSLDQFRDTLWQEFRSQTVGLCLYRGCADFSKQMRWDDSLQGNWEEWQTKYGSAGENRDRLFSLFCRDVASEYLNLLASRLPDPITCFVCLDVMNIENPLLIAQLLSKECFPRICLCVRGARGLGGELAWGDSLHSNSVGTLSLSAPFQKNHDPILIGVCLPSMSHFSLTENQVLDDVLIKLEAIKSHFRMIPESLLTTDWDGLDLLIVQSEGISVQGIRKLRGFCAAGGTVVVAGKSLELHNEITFENWYSKISRKEDQI